MTIKDKSKKNNHFFTKRLTDWMTLNETVVFAKPFYKHCGRKAYGRHFVIKRRGRRKEYALYIRKENKLKRVEDKKVILDYFKLPSAPLDIWLTNPYRCILGEIKKRCID